MIGDRYCDDTTNTLECSFDGGDCCGPDINTQYCSDCQCLDGEGGRGNFGKGVNKLYDMLVRCHLRFFFRLAHQTIQ